MEHKYNYIIVGSGLAGLYCALKASAFGKVGLITKRNLTDSNSYNAQGGIAAVYDKNDKPVFHFDDTIVAGRGLCDFPSVDILVNEGPQRIDDIIKRGMKFDMDKEGHITLGLEGGHHKRRIFHAGGDATGRYVTSFVLDQVKKEPNVEMFSDHALLGFLTRDGKCEGVRCWNYETDKEEILLAPHTVIATGGTAAAYTHSTNPRSTTGDGIAIAYRAGCEVEDMEFIQFHPTAICKEGADTFLVSEAVRGEGAWLLNHAGERFLLGKHELNELAPRDFVAQMIDREIKKEGKGCVYLSLKHLDPEAIKSRFPTIYAKCAEYGIDMCDRIPIAPAAHYTVGGICCDEEGRTNIENLFVCGEAASTGVMGANRLASNSLLECMVFAQRIVDFCARQDSAANSEVATYDTEFGTEVASVSRVEAYGSGFSPVFHRDAALDDIFPGVRKKVAELLTEYAGIVRDDEGLQKGLSELQTMEDDIRALPQFSEEEINSFRCLNLITVARLIMNGAFYRKESRGCMKRSDYTEENPAFEVHTVQQIGKEMTTRAIKK